jgi:hypothetical protein
MITSRATMAMIIAKPNHGDGNEPQIHLEP